MEGVREKPHIETGTGNKGQPSSGLVWPMTKNQIAFVFVSSDSQPEARHMAGAQNPLSNWWYSPGYPQAPASVWKEESVDGDPDLRLTRWASPHWPWVPWGAQPTRVSEFTGPCPVAPNWCWNPRWVTSEVGKEAAILPLCSSTGWGLSLFNYELKTRMLAPLQPLKKQVCHHPHHVTFMKTLQFAQSTLKTDLAGETTKRHRNTNQSAADIQELIA